MVMKISLLDFDASKSVLIACIIMVSFMGVILLFPVIAWVILIAFGITGVLVGYHLYNEHKIKTAKVTVIQPKKKEAE